MRQAHGTAVAVLQAPTPLPELLIARKHASAVLQALTPPYMVQTARQCVSCVLLAHTRMSLALKVAVSALQDCAPMRVQTVPARADSVGLDHVQVQGGLSLSIQKAIQPTLELVPS